MEQHSPTSTSSSQDGFERKNKQKGNKDTAFHSCFVLIIVAILADVTCDAYLVLFICCGGNWGTKAELFDHVRFRTPNPAEDTRVVNSVVVSCSDCNSPLLF